MMKPRAVRCAVGVDGCRSGWLGVRLRENRRPEIRSFPSIGMLWRQWGDGCGRLLIDVPVGICDAEPGRQCDRLARRLLGARRASSVFNPPVRRALAASSWEEAAELNRAVTGKGISRQGWGIVPKIREVDAFLRDRPMLRDVIQEAHPEVLFAVLNNGTAPSHPKKQEAGIEERLRILEQHYPGAGDFAARAFVVHPRKAAGRDDVVDALVAAVAAFRYGGRLRYLPADPPADSCGLRMGIAIPDLDPGAFP